ncbi:Crp/Fnr family transcriptional regulator [Poseidonibacter antarcticus]|uniref:Crp/Fnr family transcriptional regulator n=1 Tax=Poseidonibacter antarcticus TaxID=2478538 RepID=UPI000EF48D2D|nr:Crp/Fnr family transcriptional regulator [Poseidonibacter antarcticus]
MFKKLKNNWLFSSLSKEQFDKFISLASIENHKKDSVVFLAGENSEYLYLILQGEVNIHKHDDNANSITIGIFKENDFVGEAASLLHIPFPSTASFISDGKIMKIKTIDFEENFMSDITISNFIVISLLKKIQLLQQNIHLNIHLTAKDKIINFYLKNINLQKNIKQYEIANILSMAPETFSRNLKLLVKEKKLKKLQNNNYEVISS